MATELVLRVAHLLTETYSNKETAARNAAEAELKNMSEQGEVYWNILLMIISSSSADFNSQLKTSAASYLRTFIRNLKDQSKLNASVRIPLVEAMVNTILNAALDSKLLDSLAHGFYPLLSIDSQDPTGETVRRFGPVAIQLMAGEARQAVIGLKLVKATFNGLNNNSQISEYFKLSIPAMVKLAQTGMLQLDQCVAAGNNTLILEAISVLIEWMSALTSILEHLEITVNKALREFLQYTDIIQILSKILEISLFDQVLQVNSLIYLSRDPIFIELNKLKSQTLQGVNILIQYLHDEKKKLLEEEGKVQKVMTLIGEDLPDHPLITTISTTSESYIKSLIAICNRNNLNEFTSSEDVSDIIKEVLLLFNKVTSETRFYSIFSVYAKQLILNVCMNLLMADSDDIDSFESTPDEFVANSMDLCERQDSETAKTCASQLLESLCEHIDGCLSFTVNFVTQVIDFAVTGNTNEGIQFYSLLKENMDSRLVNVSQETKIETGFLTLCILSYAITHRKDLLTLVEKLLATHFDKFEATTSGLIQNRLLMMLYFYAELIFEENMEMYSKLINFLYKHLNPNVTHKAVHIQACDTFSYLANDDDVMIKMEPYIEKMVASLIPTLTYQSEKSFFEAFQEVIQTYSDMIPNLITPILQGLVSKIIAEVSDSSKKESIIMIKCWNIIRGLADTKDIVTNKLPEFENALLPLFSYIENPQNISFEDDIILVQVSMMKRTRRVTEIGWKIFDNLYKIQEKNSNRFNQIFSALNCYLVFGKDELMRNQNRLGLLVEMCGKCLNCADKDKINEAQCSEGAIIYQLMLQTLPGALDGLLDPILSKTLTRYMLGVRQGFFKVRLIGVVLSAFIYNTALTTSILSAGMINNSNSYLQYVINELINITSEFVHTYDKKVAVLGLIYLLRLDTIPQQILPLISQLFMSILRILTATKPTADIDMRPKDPMDDLIDSLIKDDDSDEELSDLDLSIQGTNLLELARGKFLGGKLQNEEYEANLALSSVTSPLQEVDELEQFRSFMKQLNTTNPSALGILVGPLDSVQREVLAGLLKSHRVNLNSNTGEQSAVRRIVKAKSKFNK